MEKFRWQPPGALTVKGGIFGRRRQLVKVQGNFLSGLHVGFCLLRFSLASGIVGLAAGPLAASIDTRNFDQSVSPKDDFYQYVNGAWLKNHPIPPAYTSWNSFEEVNEHVETILRAIMEGAAEGKSTDPLAQKVGDFYASGLNLPEIEQAGLSPLLPRLREIEAVRTREGLIELTARFHEQNLSALFSFGSEQNEKDSRQVIASATQGGLSLPGRDYYLLEDADSVKLRRLFSEHVTRAFVLLGDSPSVAKTESAQVLSLETQLARASKTAVELRDPVSNYHFLSRAELQKLTPHFQWDLYSTHLHVNPPSVDVGQPDFFRALDRLIAETPVNDWKGYYRYHLLNDSAAYLAKAYDDEFFSFYGKTLSGAEEHHERWKRVLSTVSNSLDQAVGQLFVRDHFPAESKQRMLAMIENLRTSLRERIQHVNWMDEVTRGAALQKLDHLGIKVGYPDKWIDYSSVSIHRGSYAENVFQCSEFSVRRDLAKIGHPVDRQEWDMSPQTINAYYSPNMNEIVFPAAILSPPYFDSQASDAENYGAIGAVIGHEMTHGFDDNGRLYDEVGNLRDWWTPASAENFKARAAAIVKQFNSYTVLNDLHINGALTQGENIADLGGLRIAFAALEKAKSYQQKPVGPFSNAQLFFLSFATIWRSNIRPETLRVDVNTDPHSPAKLRVNGPLSNLPAFYQAFQVPPGAPMRRAEADRVQIW